MRGGQSASHGVAGHGVRAGVASRAALLLPRSMRGTSRRATWRRAKLRRVASALLVGLAAWLAASALLPTATPVGEPVVVAVRDLPAGQRLTAPDLQISRWPAQLRPHAAFQEIDHAVGRTITGPISRGEAVSGTRVRGADLLHDLPTGEVMAHVVVSDPGLATLLRAGDRVDAISTADGAVLGANLLVLAGGSTGSPGGHGSWMADPADIAPGSASATDTTGVLVAASPAVASRLARSLGAETPGAGVMLTLRRAG